VLSEVGSNRPLNRVKDAPSLTEALGRAESYCKDCKIASPMVCVERCDVWRVKHEILEVKRFVNENMHTRQLLNAVKNKRRLKILDAFCERSLSVRELQRHLRESGFRHSRSTILEAYLKPLLRVGLVGEDGVRFRATFYGRMVQGLLSEHGSMGLLPLHSCCYEEVVLKELCTPKTFGELATLVPPKSLSRILMRLRAKGLLAEKPRSNYVLYHRVKGKLRMPLSPTEKRVFEAIPQTGIAIRSLSSAVGINIRRTFKYLHRLREKKLVFALKTRRTYELTVQGRDIANILDEIEKLAESSLNVPVPVAHSLP